jgi:hypothetical protein
VIKNLKIKDKIMDKTEIKKQIEVLENAVWIARLNQHCLPTDTFDTVIYGLNRIKMEIQELSS